MWGYGSNYDGQLGGREIGYRLDEPTCISNIETNPLYGIVITDISLVIDYSDEYGLALDNTGKVYYFGDAMRPYFEYYGSIEPTCLNTMENSPLNDVVITQISAGGTWNALFLDNTGKVWTFLSDGGAVAGTNNTEDNGFPVCINDVENNPLADVIITEISAGSNNSIAIDSEGNVWSWGSDYGDNADYYINIPVCLSDIPTNPLYGIKAQKISSGANHALILDTQGKVWGYGENWSGELLYEDEWYDIPVCLSAYENSEIYNKTITDISAGWDGTCLVDSENNYYLLGRMNVQIVT